MAKCPICNQPIKCAEHGEVQPSLGGVAKCAVQHGALWVLVHDGAGYDAKGVTIDVGGAKKTTDATGLAGFEPLEDGAYTVRLEALSVGVAERFDPPAEVVIADVPVSKGKIASVELVLRPKPTLKVVLAPTLAAAVKLDHEVHGTIATKDTVDGVADFGPVPAGKHTITVTLADGPAKTHAAPAVTPTVTLVHGQAKEQPVQLVERVLPVAKLAKDAVAVGGARVALALTADRAWNGKGKLRVTAGAASIKLYRANVLVALVDGAVDFPGIDQTGVELAIEAEAASAHQGVVFEWGLESDAPCAPAVTTKLTAVKATLTIHDKAGTAITPDVARADGRVVHLQDVGKERARAKLVVACQPPEYAGKLVLKATKDNLTLYTKAKDGDVVALPCDITLPILPGANPPAELWVEGKTVSAAKLDSGLELAIEGLAVKADHVVITVVETKLVVCGERPAVGEPPPLAADAKRDPGRALFLQGNQFLSPRALVRVLKVPHDAPCKLKLKASGDEVRLFPKECKDKANKTVSLEMHASTETAVVLPRDIGPLEITDAVQGLVLWAEGAKKTVAKLKLQLDIDAVDDACDHVAFTVAPAVFEIEVARKDLATLSEVVVVELREKQGGPTVATANVPKATGKVQLEVPPGAYLVGLGPKLQEKDFRILRDGDSLETAVRVEAKAQTKVSYKLELEPTYDKIQFVGYRIETGKYIGQDDKTAFAGTAEEKVIKAAKHDIEGRCKLMTAAVKDAEGHADIDPSVKTLKIFVAPEFYFRGRLGAYPYETVSMVLDELRKETKDPKYAHWLFVFGSAIGSMELAKRKEHTGTAVTIVSTSKQISFLCGDTAPAAGIANTWLFKTWNATFTVMASSSVITTVTDVPSGRPNVKKKQLDCATVPVFDVAGVFASVDNTTGTHVGVHVDVATRPVTLRATCTTATPLVGWGIEQGTLPGIITAVTPKGSDVYEIVADVKLGPLMVTATNIKIVEPGKAEIINIAQVQKGGGGVPVNKDGSRALKELLVYKETISSVDFKGLDYGPLAFYSVDRHLAELDGDPLCKLYPTPGAKDVLGTNPNVQGQPRVDGKGNPGTGTASEVTTSGLGGGSVFTMHDITFGLEVCLDHGEKRLKKYYGGAAKSGEPKVQVQLIPSCGMAIDVAGCCCVADGLVFNVDAHHHAAKKTNGAADITVKPTKPTPTVPGGMTITDYFPANGEIVVYPAENTPTKALVP
jgi:hypothetical protein